ncbi:MAG TPA: hypothetical protein VG916_15725 [Gemmatimonadaceae bacterium]|nr:hypothetical protein [Gemmatimonadaceae bacterium]
MTLDELVQQLRAAHGDALRGVVLYGSTVAADASARGHSVLVVVGGLDVRAMQAGGAIAQAWEDAGNPAPLTLTEPEWRSSVDVFAIEHADIAERHRVLYAAAGFAPVDRAAVQDADVRRQLEYELLALLLSVRSAIALAGRDAKAQRGILSANASRVAALLRAILRLERRPVPPDAADLCREVATIVGFDAQPFVAALRQRRGADVPKAGLEGTLGGFHAGLATLVAWVDARPASH